MTDRFFRFVFLWLSLATLAAEPPAGQTPEEEAPETLFDQKIGDVGVVLEADGTWTTRLAGGWGQGTSPLGVLPALGYPGYEKGGVFVQVPDFTLTLRLLERYYLDIVYSGTLEDRSFLVGYQGKEGEPLQSVKLGNAGFSFPSRAGQALAPGRTGAPALGATGVLGPVSLEVLGRYEDGTRETRTYHGFRETSASQIGLDHWIRGRFFRLPLSQRPWSGLKIAVREGNRYREATNAEATVDLNTGEVVLAVPAARSFAVTWAQAASWDNAATSVLGLTATDVSTEPGLDSGTWFLLAQPGTATAFELRNRYASPPDTQQAIALVDRNTGTPVAGYQVGQAPLLGWFDVSGVEEAPFAERFPGIYPGSAPPPDSKTLPWVFQLPSAASSTSFSLGQDVAGSSLFVVRNGIPTGAYRFEANTGILQFDTPVYDTDLVEISFQRSTTERKASDLLLWQGGRWDVGPQQNLEWALQSRWNMDKGSYTTQDLQSPGRLAASLAYQGQAGPLQWRLEGTGGALLTDSTGRRRLYGLEASGTSVRWDGDSLRPSSAPGLLGGAILSEANRAPLAFRNYWTNDPLTGKPDVATWGKQGIEREPGGVDGWVGPYLVRGDGLRSDRLAVLESDPESGEWMGLQSFVEAGKPRDLKTTTAVSITVRVPAGAGTGHLYWQAGTLSDNWDGSGATRKLEYRALPALAFFDQRDAQRKFFPIPESSVWGNDADGDGSTNGDGSLVSRDWVVSSDQWETVRFLLTDSERQFLQRTTGWRLVYVEDLGGASRTVLVGPVVFEGSTWSVVAAPSADSTSSVNPIEEPDSTDKSRQQLRVDWVGREQWTVEGRHSPVRPTSYRSLSFRYRLSGTTGTTTLTVALADSAGHEIRVTWNAAQGSGWTEARLDLASRQFFVDGVATGKVSQTPGATSWDRLTLTKGGDSSSGQIVLSQVEATDPLWEPVATSLATTTWRQPGPWPSAAWPVVSGLVWNLTSRQSGLTEQDLEWRGQTTLAGSLGPLRASGEATMLRSATLRSVQASYEATLPLGWSGGPTLEWTDRFSDIGLRSERLVLVLPWLGQWDALAAAHGPPQTLDQDYSVGWKLGGLGGTDWGFSAAAHWFQTRPEVNPLTNFGSVWSDSWSWLVPSPLTAPFYLVSGEASVRGALGPWSLDVKSKNQVSQSLGSERLWSAWGNWEVKTPFRPQGPNGWSLTPSASRAVEGVYTGLDERSPQQSAAAGARWLWSLPGSLTGLPLVELTATQPWSDADQEFRSGLSQSTLGLDWERASVSDWSDLVVPSSAGLTGTTRRGQEGLAEHQSQTVAGRIQAKAINIFGSLGSSPLVEWYRTDVWSWGLTGLWGEGSRVEDNQRQGSLTLRSDLFLTADESVALPVAYQIRGATAVAHELKLTPGWSLRGPANLPVELPRWLSPSAFRRQWIQDLGLAINLGWSEEVAPLVRDLQVTWQGRLSLSEKSELKLTTKWGQQWQNDLTVVGLEAALDLVLSF